MDITSSVITLINLHDKNFIELHLKFIEQVKIFDNKIMEFKEENEQLKSKKEKLDEEIFHLKTEIETLDDQLKSLKFIDNKVSKNELTQRPLQLQHGLSDE
jgi:phage shock protein A